MSVSTFFVKAKLEELLPEPATLSTKFIFNTLNTCHREWRLMNWNKQKQIQDQV